MSYDDVFRAISVLRVFTACLSRSRVSFAALEERLAAWRSTRSVVAVATGAAAVSSDDDCSMPSSDSVALIEPPAPVSAGADISVAIPVVAVSAAAASVTAPAAVFPLSSGICVPQLMPASETPFADLQSQADTFTMDWARTNGLLSAAKARWSRFITIISAASWHCVCGHTGTIAVAGGNWLKRIETHLGSKDNKTAPAWKSHNGQLTAQFTGPIQAKLSFAVAPKASPAAPVAPVDVRTRSCAGLVTNHHVYYKRDGTVAFIADPMRVIDDVVTEDQEKHYIAHRFGTGNHAPLQHFRHTECKVGHHTSTTFSPDELWTCKHCMSIPDIPLFRRKMEQIRDLPGGVRPENRTYQQTGGYPTFPEITRLLHDFSEKVARLNRKLGRGVKAAKGRLSNVLAMRGRSAKSQAKVCKSALRVCLWSLSCCVVLCSPQLIVEMLGQLKRCSLHCKNPDVFITFVQDMVRNSVTRDGGKRWSDVSKEITSYVALKCPIVGEMLANNLVIPSKRTAQRVICGARLPRVLGVGNELILAAIEIFTSIMAELKIPPGKLPCRVAVDETAIVANPVLMLRTLGSQRVHSIVGFCCKKCMPSSCQFQMIDVPEFPADRDGLPELKAFLAEYTLGSCTCICDTFAIQFCTIFIVLCRFLPVLIEPPSTWIPCAANLHAVHVRTYGHRWIHSVVAATHDQAR